MNRTPFFDAVYYVPPRPGHYRCKLLPPYGSDEKPHIHYRYHSGEHWTEPLDFDEDLDGDAIPMPTPDQFLQATSYEDLVETHLSRFAWQGYAADPNDEL